MGTKNARPYADSARAPWNAADQAIEKQQPQASGQQLLLLGASDELANAFAARCRARTLACTVAGSVTDLTDPDAVEWLIRQHRPWAIVNASGARAPSVGSLEPGADQALHHAHLAATGVLAAAALRHGLPYLMFSSPAVLGEAGSARDEAAAPAPVDAFGRCQAAAERCALLANPRTLIIRSGHFFGVDGETGLLARALAALRAGEPVALPADLVLAPTYLPDLVDACLDLAVDGEQGIWHLYNDGGVAGIDLVARAAGLLDLATMKVDEEEGAPSPVLQTRRGKRLPSLDYALDRFAAASRASSADLDRRTLPRS